MCVQVIVEPVGPAIHQRLQPIGAGGELGLHVFGIDEELHAQVAPDFGFARRFRQSALREEEVVLDAVEIVLSLRVHEAEDCVGVGGTVDVRNPPGISGDRYLFGPALPAGHGRIGHGRIGHGPTGHGRIGHGRFGHGRIDRRRLGTVARNDREGQKPN
jgi:hypothetical protein